MNGALTVRINDGTTDRTLNRQASGLRFRKTAPGGHHSASVNLSLPRSTFSDLGPNDRMFVYDARTGRTVWEGYTDNPGAQDGAEGESFELQASGGVVLTNDMASQVVFIERSLDDSLWVRTDNATPGGTDTTTDGVLQFQFPSGIPIGTTSRVVKDYQGIYRAGMRLGSCIYSVQAGFTDPTTQYQLQTRPGSNGAGASVARNDVFNTTRVDNIEIKAGTHFPVGLNTVDFRIIYLGGATNVTSDQVWGAFSGIAIRPILSDASGNDVLSGYLTYWLYAHEVVNHLLGSMLPTMDGPNATVATGTRQITQLTYHDGATPQRILDDLSLYEPDLLWEVLETNEAGKHRFNYRAWPTTARYEVSTKDGYSAPGGEVDLCNRIVVTFTDAATRTPQNVVVTQDVPSLGTRVRDADPIGLPDGVASNAGDAAWVGQQVLAAKATPPKAATAQVARPIMDLQTGRTVMPWQIQPGYLVRVRETGDLLRLTEMEYGDDDVSATLTLGQPTRSVDQIVAQLAARR